MNVFTTLLISFISAMMITICIDMAVKFLNDHPTNHPTNNSTPL
jgi:hypothetical protein